MEFSLWSCSVAMGNRHFEEVNHHKSSIHDPLLMESPTHFLNNIIYNVCAA